MHRVWASENVGVLIRAGPIARGEGVAGADVVRAIALVTAEDRWAKVLNGAQPARTHPLRTRETMRVAERERNPRSGATGPIARGEGVAGVSLMPTRTVPITSLASATAIASMRVSSPTATTTARAGPRRTHPSSRRLSQPSNIAL
jgi:hypothetical protein